ncbi:hypothetical protein [Thalassospira xiamenensis]|uniref:Uncharacterized protein n=1 Tax=Thalassospira xiamenensis TaxID=220697 RepID=A0A285TUT0_9PROT|nr:hypothetical protein [Thalassospira xiamenensis]SOC27263.1 hypothetical protein SAMN05428964_105343 [Thalassospira xiamenensis]
MATTQSFFLNRFIDRLRGRTALSPAQSPFASFGALSFANERKAVSADADHTGVVGRVAKAALFTVDEARRRMKDFLHGSFEPSDSKEFTDYLKVNLLGLEKRFYANGQSQFHVVDKISRHSLKSTDIDPVKLSNAAIHRMSTKARQIDKAASVEASAAIAVRERLSPLLRSSIESGKPPFSSWDDVGFMMPQIVPGSAYTETNGRGYIGTQVAHCLGTAAETKELLIQKQRELSAELGRPVKFVFDRTLPPGSPILLADSKLVRAEMVHVSLGAAQMSRQFGVNQADHMRARLGEMPTNSPNSALMTVEAFKAKFAKKREVAEASNPVIEGPSYGGVALDKIVVQYSGGQPTLRGPGHALLEVNNHSAHSLPAGEYPKENAWGIPEGRILVDKDGNVRHLNNDGVEHNFDGPSFEPAPGNTAPARWSLDGEQFSSQRDFHHARQQSSMSGYRASEDAPANTAEQRPSLAHAM